MHANINECGSGKTPTSTIEEHGGFFDKGSSTTWKQAANINASGAAPDFDDRFEGDLWGTDTVNINSTLTVEDVPIAIIRNVRQGTNLMGLGRNSTFVNALIAKGAIPSKAWGLAMGWQGATPNHQADGSLVLGGYDSAKIHGLNSTYPFAEDASGSKCPGGLVVTISNIALNLANGSSPSLLPPSAGSALRACLDPSFQLLQLPQDIFLNFLDVMNYRGNYPDRSHGINYWGMVVKSEDAYLSDMTITLSPGLDIRIPNHQLVVPDWSVNARGFITEANSSSREILINSLQDVNANDMPLLGAPFFSASYLLVDQEREQFTLWQGDPTSTEERLIPIAPSAACTASTSGESSPATNTTPSPERVKGKKSISTGGIVGIIIGGLTALVILCLVLFCYLRRRRHPRPSLPTSTSETADPRLSSYMAFKPELPTDTQPPQEMPLEQNPGHAIAPYEIAGKERRAELQ
ncbi:MAG: hypothetical protein Q9225_007598 [Loekoesia sp. 1 TL-2023]